MSIMYIGKPIDIKLKNLSYLEEMIGKEENTDSEHKTVFDYFNRWSRDSQWHVSYWKEGHVKKQ